MSCPVATVAVSPLNGQENTISAPQQKTECAIALAPPVPPFSQLSLVVVKHLKYKNKQDVKTAQCKTFDW